MKKCLLALLTVLALILTACSGRNVITEPQRTAPPVEQEAAPVTQPTEDDEEIYDNTSGLMSMQELLGGDELPDDPDEPAVGDADELPDVDDQPTVEEQPTAAPTPVPTATPVPGPTAENPFAGNEPEQQAVFSNVTVKNLSFVTLTDPSFGFLMNYPADWVNKPGKYTVCFEEPEPATAFPARVAVTRKQLAHKPKAKAVYTQFQSYAQVIYDQYDPKTFEYGDVNSNAVFMGHQAYEVTYLAYSGDVEVEGYLCCCSINKAIYVFHFCCPYDEYDSYANAMMQMRDSVATLEDDEE